MTKIINLQEVRDLSNTIKKILKLSFVKNFDDELYLEESTNKNNVLDLKIRHFGNSSNSLQISASECPYEGGYEFNISDKTIFLNYAESLDLYVMLNSLFKGTDSVRSIETIMEE
jgi:hypothetical protein